MNTEILTLPAPLPQTSRRSKISRLPKKLRQDLNEMLDDGVPYAEIKERLGEPLQDITADNISEWKTRGGYQDWLKEQFWREQARTRLESLTEVSADADPIQLPLAGLQISLLQVCEQLRDLGPGARKEAFENNADQYLRMLNTLARLSRSMLALQQFRQSSAQKSPTELKQHDPAREFGPSEREALLDRADDLFNLKSAARLRREWQQSGQSANQNPLAIQHVSAAPGESHPQVVQAPAQPSPPNSPN